ncbi:BgTH12-07036 [Blumeria graminis f. sp. triticale]|uniref:Ribosome assembly protein 1 n=1 Tax=Blumeria graminis f. sp. triticale TaxID=1689686 RepID=A0A9W4GIC8_BLUGR|nr:BgTH12-07036 [Blumeria graminis f. sp. triticale]
MPVISPDKLIALQQDPRCIRNICVLAHVDHGKTSLTDALIATNGIISSKLAGKIRYLDSRPDEQSRGITMQSSAISLHFSMGKRPAPEMHLEQADYLINLIDSPGHIDFSSEVSTASRLCDGAVILIDAVEGVCSQTITVLRQAWVERLKSLLVINKMDRLVTELKMTPSEAYTHLSKLLEQVNAVLGSFFHGERMEEDLNWRDEVEKKIAENTTREPFRSDKAKNDELNQTSLDSDNLGYEEKDDGDLYFSPERNNVIFSSALDGWAFTVRQFASFYEKKLGINRKIMEKTLWGDFYLDPKSKKILSSKHLKGRNLKPMFCQLVLEQIWAVYRATIVGEREKGDQTMVERITKSLNITIPTHVTRSPNPRTLLSTVFSSWIPLSTALLVSVIESLPSPSESQKLRLPGLIDTSPGAAGVDPVLRNAMINSNSSAHSPAIAYISKMISVPQSELPENKHRGKVLSPEEAREVARQKRAEIARARAREADEVSDPLNHFAVAIEGKGLSDSTTSDQLERSDPEVLIGFARIYSGTLSVGDSIYVLPPKFSPENLNPDSKPTKVTITALYLLMGRELETLQSVPAGVIFGIGGLEGHILKSGTICSQIVGSVNLAGISMGSQPIVRVALEPENPANLERMISGLKLLVQSDPCAEYEQFESGEHVLLTAGELHLERCLTDLRDRFANCEIQAGEPIVPFRETIVRADEMRHPMNRELGRGTMIATTASKQAIIKLSVRPLSANITQFLRKNSDSIRQLNLTSKSVGSVASSSSISSTNIPSEIIEENENSGAVSSLPLLEFKTRLGELLQSMRGPQEMYVDKIDKIMAFGPRRAGPNLLIDATAGAIFSQSPQVSTPEEVLAVKESLQARDFGDRISYAFQLATAQGPLCHEPVEGIVVFIEEVKLDPTADAESPIHEKLGRLTSEIIKITKSAIQQCFLDWSPRLCLAMYSCEIQASTEVLGRVYDVLTRRRGRVLSEALKEGTSYFTIQSLLPVAESFGFSDEIRKRTSGAASPQLIFQGYEILNEDPLWVPFTDDDLEDLGELADKEIVAKRYMDTVRKRKGLVVSGMKLVKDAEKQKTLKR